MTASFADQFKKYRLKSELARLSDLGNALAEKGFIYEDSIFSHWQKGSRIPQNRVVLIKLIEIFVDRGSITTEDQANKFLSSANQGYLSETEISKLRLTRKTNIFQVPNEISDFVGRQDVIKSLSSKNLAGKIIVIHGPAGIGKTALAIKLGHLLRDKYADGVLWYKIEDDNLMDILLSIAKVFGEDINDIKSLEVRGTVVRSLLTNKNILLFLDSAELSRKVNILIPNSHTCTVVVTTQKSNLNLPTVCLSVKLDAFNDQEILGLFKRILKEKFEKFSKNSLLKSSDKVGKLPLAVHIIARNLYKEDLSAKNEKVNLEGLYLKDESLNSAIELSYKKLNVNGKSVLISASIFKGKDFSLKSISYINGLSEGECQSVLESLVDLSLLEQSTKNRYRIHPAIQDFFRKKLNPKGTSNLFLYANLIFGFFSLWWIYLQLFVSPGNNMYHTMGSTYFILAFYGAICGIATSRLWGGLSTLLGRAILMFSIGLLGQVFGQIAYSYYTNILRVNPYPSVGDAGYFGAIFFYIYGAVLLAKSSGIKINIQLFRKELIAIVVPAVMVSVAYILFLQGYELDLNDPVKTILDFGYPLGEAIYISIAIVIFILSRNMLDGIMRSNALFLLIALLAQFLMDYLFILNYENYTSGNYIDFLSLLAYYFMTIALMSLRSIQVKVKI